MLLGTRVTLANVSRTHWCGGSFKMAPADAEADVWRRSSLGRVATWTFQRVGNIKGRFFPFFFSFRMKALYSFHCLYCLSVSSDRASNAALGRILLGLFSGIKITEHTEYQFPKEQTLCYSENRIADVTKIKAMRPRKSGYAIFPPKDGRQLPKEHDYRLFCLFRTNRYSVNSAIGSRIDGILFRSFRNQNRSQKNTITVNYVYSHSGIVPKERGLRFKVTWWRLTRLACGYFRWPVPYFSSYNSSSFM